MPIYEYQCLNCGHKFECLQKISDAPLVVCPQCADPGLEKIISLASFQLKGSGWYKAAAQAQTKEEQPKEAKKSAAKAKCKSCSSCSCTKCK